MKKSKSSPHLSQKKTRADLWETVVEKTGRDKKLVYLVLRNFEESLHTVLNDPLKYGNYIRISFNRGTDDGSYSNVCLGNFQCNGYDMYLILKKLYEPLYNDVDTREGNFFLSKKNHWLYFYEFVRKYGKATNLVFETLDMLESLFRKWDVDFEPVDRTKLKRK